MPSTAASGQPKAQPFRMFPMSIKLMTPSLGFRAILVLSALLFLLALLNAPINPQDRQTAAKRAPPDRQTLAIPVFEDKTLDYGIRFIHQQGDETLAALDDTLGSGVCVLDYDRDGFVDLFLVNGTGQTRYYGKPYWWQAGNGNALLRNINGERFEDVTKTAGLTGTFHGMGCVSADFDNDGDPDLLLTNLGENVLYKNNGDGSFSDITQASGIAGEHWSTSATVADFNHDGLLDIYIANYVSLNRGSHTYEPSSQFSQDMPILFQGGYYQPQAKLLYKNLGGLKFEEVSIPMNAGNSEGRTLGVAWLDVNDDGWEDLILANDKGVASNAVLLNQQGTGFKSGKTASGIHSSAGHRGISLGDLDNDGDMDIVLASDKSNAPMFLAREDNASTWYVDRARGMGVNVEYFAGMSGWTPGAFDFNNDGWLDVFLANGLAVPDQDTGRVPTGQPKQLWMNTGGGHFLDASKQAGVALADAQSARGAAFADFDNDGDIDAYVAHNNDLGQLLINQSPPDHHWIGFRLEAKKGNRDAIGARILITTQFGKQTRLLAVGNGFLSDSDRRVNVGLGKSDVAKEVNIVWPDGSMSEWHSLKADHYYRIQQADSSASIELPTASKPMAKYSSLNLAVGKDDPNNRIAYLQILASILGIESALPEFEIAAQDDDATVREAVVGLLEKHKSNNALYILTRTLQDTDASVAAKAVEALCAYEDEASVRWLLRAFKSPEPNVRVALAECFGYFYREEEAVIHRKYLALPYLIRLLQDPSAKVRSAAARALGDAERYRAVQPLLDALSDSDPAVRAQAVRALGLNREAKAVNAVLSILKSPEQTPEIHAQALIALKRLGWADFPITLHEYILGLGAYKDIPADFRLGTIKFAIDNQEEGIVLSQDALLKNAIDLAKSSPNTLYQQNGGVAAAELIEILQGTSSQEALPILLSLRHHENPAVRAKALQSLAVLDKDKQTAYLQDGMSDGSVSVRLALLDTMEKLGITAKSLEPLLLNALDGPDTRVPAIKALARIGNKPTLGRLLSIASHPGEPAVSVEAAANALADARLDGQDLPDSVYQHPDPSVRKAAFAFWLKHQAAFIPSDQMPARFNKALGDGDDSVKGLAGHALAGRREAWALRKIEACLADAEADRAVRAALLEDYKPLPSGQAKAWLENPAAFKSDPLRLTWLNKLFGEASIDSDKLAWRVLNDTSENAGTRMTAAKALANREGIKVINALRGNCPRNEKNRAPTCGD
jgi:HEAT repeat protein